MGPLEWFFWICVWVVVYTYLLYPLSLIVLNLIGRRREGETREGEAPAEPYRPSVSILLAVHNEEHHLPRRLEELNHLIQTAGLVGEIIVISDASTDRSAEIAIQAGARVIEQPEKQGKAAALDAGSAIAQHDLLILADARQHWADDALTRLVENFADPAIGAVSGDLVLETAPGVLAGVGMYWRFEKWLRKQESRLYSQVGVTGAISAVRRELFEKIPPGTLLDDVFWPMHVVLKGYRVIHDERAKAFDRLPENPRDEFRRKVRTLAGNFQLATRLPMSALFPWSNRVWWQWVSHKLMRLVVPWALLGMFVSCLFLTDDFYQIALYVQATGYAVGVLGLIPAVGKTVRPLGAASSFLVLNAAAWCSFWVWITGQAGKSWHRVQYQPTAEDA